MFLAGTVMVSSVLMAQPQYRTFSQEDLSLKKAKAGKVISSDVCFVFKNDSTGITVNSLHARFNAAIISIKDSGGFSSIIIEQKRKVITATGRTVAAGDSVALCFTFDKKGPGTHTNFWWWDTNGTQAGVKRSELVGSYSSNSIQPNGGNVLEFLYKRVITRPNGLVVGLPTDTPDVGWIRYKKADRKYFPHNGPARCFDVIATGSSVTHAFDAELKNPHVKKHNNHLLGELHALKLAVVANDSGVAEPQDTSATPLGDLIYNDPSNVSDPLNNMTLRQIIQRADSALTYCSHFAGSAYIALDSSISKINAGFDGDYFALAGTHTLGEVPFLHPNPASQPVIPHLNSYSIVDEVPGEISLRQNYPNPFNPSTAISFELARPSIVSLTVYNILGQEVASLVNNEILDGGEQVVDFNADAMTSGVYFYRLAVQEISGEHQVFQAVKRMLLLK
jgi:hypothetical protein